MADNPLHQDQTACRTPEEVAGLLEIAAGADVRATIGDLEGVLGRLRPALAARDELRDRVSAHTLKQALKLRAEGRGSW